MSSPESDLSLFDGSSPTGSEKTNATPNQSHHEAPQTLDQMNITETQADLVATVEEDVNMTDAEPTDATLPLVTGTTSSPVKSNNNLIDTLKKMVYRRDQYLNLLSDMINTDSNDPQDIKHLGEIRDKVDDLNKGIHVMRNSVRLSKEKVVSESAKAFRKVPLGGGIRLNRNDLPKFQLKTSVNKYFPKEDNFESVNHFLRSFEKVVSSSGEEIELVWKRYIPLTLHYDLDGWLNNELLLCNSWADVGALFNKKFGNNAVMKLQSRRQVFNATMKVGETTEDYTTRFNKAVAEAGYAEDNVTIGDAFLMGFPRAWQTQINTLLHCTYVDRDHWSIEEIHTAAINIFGNQMATISFINAKTRLPSSEGENTPGSSKRFKTTENKSFYCSNHGGSAARHNEKDCSLNNKGSASVNPTTSSSSASSSYQQPKSKFLGNKNTPRAATGNTFCTWCGKLWSYGHTCPEYHEKNNGKNVRVLTVRSTTKTRNSKKDNKGKMKSDDENEKTFRENMEDSY